MKKARNVEILTKNFVLDFARSKRKDATPKTNEKIFSDEFVLDRSDTPDSRLLANKADTTVTDSRIALIPVISFEV